MKTLFNLLLMLIPRFTTDEVALIDTGDSYDIVCSMDDIEEGEVYDAVAKINIFTWFGRAWPVTGEEVSVRPWSTS